MNGVKGIHFIIDNRKNKCNKTYIQLASEEDYKKVFCYNNKKLHGMNIEGDLIFFFLQTILRYLKIKLTDI